MSHKDVEIEDVGELLASENLVRRGAQKGAPACLPLHTTYGATFERGLTRVRRLARWEQAYILLCTQIYQ